MKHLPGWYKESMADLEGNRMRASALQWHPILYGAILLLQGHHVLLLSYPTQSISCFKLRKVERFRWNLRGKEAKNWPVLPWQDQEREEMQEDLVTETEIRKDVIFIFFINISLTRKKNLKLWPTQLWNLTFSQNTNK